DANGDFTYTLSAANLTAIGQGEGKTITASQTDAAGNIGTSPAFTFAVDTIAPAAPVINTVAEDNIIDAQEAQAGLTITGTGEPGATVTLVFDSGTTLTGGNTVVVNPDGTWSVAVVAADVEAFGEGGERITATQTDAAGNVSPSATQDITVVVDTIDSFIAIAPTNAVQPEGNSGTTPFTFTVTRTGDTNVTSTANWAVTGTGVNPATADDFADGVFPSGTVTFAPGQTSQVITVNVQGDTIPEPNETFRVTLSGATNATITTATATGTILNDDASLAIAPLDATRLEGNEGLTPFTFTVTRRGDTTGTSSANWAVTGTGENPANADDFAGGVFPSGTVTFAPGQTSQVITVNVQGDTVVEPNETFRVTLSEATNATITTATATGTILNDDVPATGSILSITPLNADRAEGNSGTTPFTFTVTRTGDTNVTSTVNWAVTGTGENPASADDFAGGVFPSGTVTFAPGQRSQVITVNVQGDTRPEPNETFRVTLSGATNATITTATATGTILDDDTIRLSPGRNQGLSIEQEQPETEDIDAILGQLRELIQGAELYVPPLSFTVRPEIGDVFPDEIVRIEVDFAERPLGTPDYSVVAKRDENGSFFRLNIFDSEPPEGEVGAILRDRDGNGRIDGATLFLRDRTNEQQSIRDTLDSDPRPGFISDPFVPLAVDIEPPTVVITDNQPGVANIATGDITYTFTFSEAVTGFALEDITVTGGTPGLLTQVSPTEYILVVTPDANFEGDLTVEVAAGAAIDLAGNPSVGPEVSVQPVDTLAPTVVITDNQPGVANIATGDIIYTFTFSEPVTGFTANDITVTNGTPGEFTALSNTVYTLLVTPDANFEGNLTVAVAAGAAIDAVGNPSVGPEVSVQPVDTIAPTVTITNIGGNDSIVSGVAGDNTVVGTAEARSGNVTIRFGNTQLGTAQVDANGRFTYSLSAANLTTIGQGTGRTITASQTDAAGNIGTSAAFTFAVDTIAPTVTITSIGGEDSIVSGVVGDNTVVGTAEARSGNVTILLGQQVLGTAAVDGQGNFTYTLSAANLETIGQGTGRSITASQTDTAGNTGTSAPFTFTVDTLDSFIEIAPLNAEQAEGNEGLTPFTFTVTRAGDTTGAISVNWEVTGTGDNPASADDFAGGVFPSGTVTFAPGQTSQVITVNVQGDTVVEPDETFTVTLSGATNAIITTATATGTILNDDGNRQQISSGDNLLALPNSTLSVPLFYNTSTGDNTLTGISLRLHYNSNELSFQDVGNLFNNNLFVPLSDLSDTDDFDNDPNTDKFIQFGYLDFAGNWPNQPLPLKLGDFNFTTTENFNGTKLNVTSDNLASGYTLESQPISVNEVFTQTSSGFVLRFNDDLDLSVLNLYRGLDIANPLAPVTDSPDLILKDGAGNPINGSLIWDETAKTLTFVKTGDILEPGSYTLTLDSRPDGLVYTNGELIDVDRNGTPGGEFQFTVESQTAPVLSLPDFSRAPGQAVDVPAGDDLIGLPIRISNPNGVDNISFTLQYDPDILAITNANVAPSSGWNFTSTPTIDPLTGQAQFTLAGPALSNTTDLIFLTAEVPETATYGNSGLLRIIPGAGLVGDSAVQLVANFGDTTGDQGYSPSDASLIARVSVGLDTGFRAFPIIDPLILGDITGNGELSPLDAARVAQRVVGFSVPAIPV
ncbi:beta strand repeat-containing protein, partial [Anabaenopsis elenkinii]